MKIYKFINKDLSLYIKSLITTNGLNYYMLFIYNDNLKKFITSRDVIDACKAGDDSIIIMLYYFLIEEIKTNKSVLFRPVVKRAGVNTSGHDCTLNAPFYIYMSKMYIPIASESTIKYDYDNTLKNDFTHGEICNGRFELVAKKISANRYNNEFITPVSVNNDIHNNIQPYQNITSLLNLESYLTFKILLNCIYTLIESSANKDNYIIHFSGVILNILHCKIKSFEELKTRLSRDLGLISPGEQAQFFTNYEMCITNIEDDKGTYTLKNLLSHKNKDLTETQLLILEFITHNNIDAIDTNNNIPVYYLLFKYMLTECTDSVSIVLFNKIYNSSNFQTYNNLDLFTYLITNNIFKFEIPGVMHETLAGLILNNIKYMHPANIIANINELLKLKNIPPSVFSKLLYIYSMNTKVDTINILLLQDTLPNFDVLLELYINYFGFLQEPINKLYKHYSKKKDVVISLFASAIKLLTEITDDTYKKNNIVELNFEPDNNYKILNVYKIKNIYGYETLLMLKSVDEQKYNSEYIQFATIDKCKPVT